MTSKTAKTRPVFDSGNGNTERGGGGDAVVEFPSLSSSNALARFEFEPGRSKDGTKVLMVEWEEDDTTRAVTGDWEISWEGKRTVLPAKDPSKSTSHTGGGDDGEPYAAPSPSPVNRLYFLLGPGVTVPTAVRLQKGSIMWRTNPLPAIFPPELGATARQAGKRGVLHTVWAKKRLQVLQNEIDRESKDNAEGIGLQMAVAEKAWIEENFGVMARTSHSSSVQLQQSHLNASAGLNSPVSPRSPGGGRLMDKLKGLKLDTSERDPPPPAAAANRRDVEHNPLSPESSDVAVGGFSSFAELKGMPPVNSLAAKPAQTPASQQQQHQQSPQKRVVAQRPPDSFAAQQRRQAGGGSMGSLNALTGGEMEFPSRTDDDDNNHNDDDDDDDEDDDQVDDLFALPMSPRSPDMAKSPFSFAAQ